MPSSRAHMTGFLAAGRAVWLLFFGESFFRFPFLATTWAPGRNVRTTRTGVASQLRVQCCLPVGESLHRSGGEGAATPAKLFQISTGGCEAGSTSLASSGERRNTRAVNLGARASTSEVKA